MGHVMLMKKMMPHNNGLHEKKDAYNYKELIAMSVELLLLSFFLSLKQISKQ